MLKVLDKAEETEAPTEQPTLDELAREGARRMLMAALLANMDSRAPRANRGAGVERQGCYRPAAVSVGPKGHGSRHSLSNLAYSG